MRKWLLGLVIVSGLGVAQAQTYIGLGATLVDFTLPLPSVQVGGVVQDVELRGTLDSTLAFNVLGLDALYSFTISGTPFEVYVGGGPDLVWIFSGGGEPFLGVHVTAGLEYLLDIAVSGVGNLGLYGELQPLFPLLGTEGLTSLIKARAGVNIYF